jgi:hypothetical protein
MAMYAVLLVCGAVLVVAATLRKRIDALGEQKRTAQFLKGKRVMITVSHSFADGVGRIFLAFSTGCRALAVASGGRWPSWLLDVKRSWSSPLVGPTRWRRSAASAWPLDATANLVSSWPIWLVTPSS